jgi:hypothetical protein
VKIGTKGVPLPLHQAVFLGFPDHTAVIVNDSIPLPTAKDGGSLKPSKWWNKVKAIHLKGETRKK